MRKDAQQGAESTYAALALYHALSHSSVSAPEEFAAHLAALRSRLDVLVPLSRDLARDAPGPEGGEKSVALDVVRELDAWTRARLVEGLRAVPV